MAKYGYPSWGTENWSFHYHVDDVIDGMILAAFAEASDGEIYYLSDGKVHTFAEVAHMLSKITGGAKIIPLRL